MILTPPPVDPLLPPAEVPPCAHQAYIEAAKVIIRQNPGMPASMVRRQSLAMIANERPRTTGSLF